MSPTIVLFLFHPLSDLFVPHGNDLYFSLCLFLDYVVLGKTFLSEENCLQWLITYKLFVSMNIQTDPEGQHNFILFYFVYMLGGLCHLSSFKQCSGTLCSSQPSLFIHLWGEKRIHISEFVSLLIYTDIINVEDWSLNFSSKMTQLKLGWKINQNWEQQCTQFLRQIMTRHQKQMTAITKKV